MGLSKSQINALITYVDNDIPPRVRRILQSFGTDAHLYLPGVGVIDGFTAGNYQDSAGTTAGAVDSVVGLALDGAGSVGSELNTSTTINSAQVIELVAGGQTVAGDKYQVLNAPAGLSWHDNTGVYPLGGLARQVITINSGGTVLNLYQATGSPINISGVSVKRLTGTHASQSTTANKPLLKSSGGKYYWQFDGSNDSLALGSVLFQMADDHCVIAAANASSLDGVNRRIFTQENGTPTTCEIEASSTALSLVWRDNAGTLGAVASTVSAGSAFVVTGVKKGNEKTGRKNGVLFGTDSTAMGATTLGASPYIGNRAASDRPFAGNIYCLIAIKGTVSDADIAVLEKWAGRLAGVTI